MMGVRSLRLRWPSSTVQSYDLLSLSADEFVLVVSEHAPESIERYVIQSRDTYYFRALEIYAIEEDIHLVEMSYTFARF